MSYLIYNHAWVFVFLFIPSFTPRENNPCPVVTPSCSPLSSLSSCHACPFPIFLLYIPSNHSRLFSFYIHLSWPLLSLFLSSSHSRLLSSLYLGRGRLWAMGFGSWLKSHAWPEKSTNHELGKLGEKRGRNGARLLRIRVFALGWGFRVAG